LCRDASAAGRPLSVPPDRAAASPSPAASLSHYVPSFGHGKTVGLATLVRCDVPALTRCARENLARCSRALKLRLRPVDCARAPRPLERGEHTPDRAGRCGEHPAVAVAWRPTKIAERFSGSRGSVAPSADSKGEVARRQTRLAVLGRSPRASGGSLRAARETRSVSRCALDRSVRK